MKGFILGFQRRVWCPKWTPDSNNSFTPMLSTIFLWLRACRAGHPAEHGIDFDVFIARLYSAFARQARIHTDTEGRFSSFAWLFARRSRTSKIADARSLAILYFDGAA
jgi:hypothetical protein